MKGAIQCLKGVKNGILGDFKFLVIFLLQFDLAAVIITSEYREMGFGISAI